MRFITALRSRLRPPSRPDGPATSSAAANVTMKGEAALIEPRALAEIATGIWRLRRKMIDPQTGAPEERNAHLHRSAQALWDALTDAEVEVRDHDGQAYDPGLSISVVAFQPSAHLPREEVIETVAPTIHVRGQLLQRGAVIVGTPASVDSTADVGRTDG